MMEAPDTPLSNPRRVSVRTKLALAMSLCIGLIALFVCLYFPRALEKQTLKAMASRAQSIGEMTAFSAAPGLFFGDADAITEALSVAQQNNDLVYLVVTDITGRVLSAYNAQEAERMTYWETNDRGLLRSEDIVYKSKAFILNDGEAIGRLYLGLSLEALRAEVKQSRASIAWLSVVIFVLGVGLVALISTVLIAPLAQITKTADRIAQGELALRTQVRSRDEVGLLARAFDHMVEKLETAYRELERQHELEQEIAVRKRAEAVLRTAKEKAEEMSRLKNTFLANMSHEIRTPLTSIIGLADTLHEEVTEDNREFTGLIRQSGHRLLETLNAVLDLAQIESGGLKMALSPIDLTELARESVNSFSIQAQDQRLYLELKMEDEPVWVMADRGGLTRALNNLISNAIKFTHDGGVTVSVHADASQAELRVTDTGIGIHDAFLPHIFDDFKQESSGLSRNYEGNGLGLTITKRLLDLMGGSIRVSSIKNGGSQFIITVPRSFKNPETLLITPQGDGWADDVPEALVVPPSDADRAPTRRALIVEDNPVIARMARFILQAYATETATNSDEAIALASTSQPFDVLLIDIDLCAERTGLDVLHELRQMPIYAQTPAIALTAYAMPGDREHFLKAGFDAYISKPFQKEHLLKTVARLLAKGDATMPAQHPVLDA